MTLKRPKRYDSVVCVYMYISNLSFHFFLLCIIDFRGLNTNKQTKRKKYKKYIYV